MSKKKQTPFFATHGDLISIAQEAMGNRKVSFVLAGLFEDQKPQILSRFEELKPREIYLIVDDPAGVRTRLVEQRGGGLKYALDQLLNPDSVALHMGGACSDQQLLAGQIGATDGSRDAVALYELFAKLIRNRFEKIKSYYVGPEAAAMLDRGVRLSATQKSPKEYDLTR